MNNYELSNDQKISTPFIFDILQGIVLHTFPDNIWDKYSRENYRISRYPFTIRQQLFSAIAVLNLKRSGQGTGYRERKTKKKKLKALSLVLGLLQVVGTVKTKGTEISTGPTTSSRHSNKRN